MSAMDHSLDLTDGGVERALKGFGINNVAKVSDLQGLRFEFFYKHGVIGGTITLPVILTEGKEEGSGNILPRIEIPLNIPQHPSFLCLFCMRKSTLLTNCQSIQWYLISNQGIDSKIYPGKLKLFYEKNKVSKLRRFINYFLKSRE